jgi:hypothetical protein
MPRSRRLGVLAAELLPRRRFPDLRAVVDHYRRFRRLGLAEKEMRNLIEYLKSL